MNNEKRLVANELMRQLYLAGDVAQLEILIAYGQACLERLKQNAAVGAQDESR